MAYELLFRHEDAEAAGVVDDLAATAAVIEHATELGTNNVIGEMLQLAENVERIDQTGQQIIPALAHLKVTRGALCDMQLGAYAWSELVSRQA